MSLGTLVLAAQWPDLLWPTLLLLGAEHVEISSDGRWPPLQFTQYPISHSLATTLGWAVLFGIVFYAVRRNLRGAVICAAAVLSHWLLDWLVHMPDLPLVPGSASRVGLGLWASPKLALAIELTLFATGWWLYVRATVAADTLGRVGAWVFPAVLILIQIGNAFGSAPPNDSAVAWVGQAQWLLVGWAYRLDAHRSRQPLASRL